MIDVGEKAGIRKKTRAGASNSCSAWLGLGVRRNAGMICREPPPRTGKAPKSPVLTFLICPRCRSGAATEVRSKASEPSWLGLRHSGNVPVHDPSWPGRPVDISSSVKQPTSSAQHTVPVGHAEFADQLASYNTAVAAAPVASRLQATRASPSRRSTIMLRKTEEKKTES